MQDDPEKLLALYVQSQRTERGWSQQELADRLRPYGLDLHSTGITRLERGDRSIRFNDFVAFCQAFEVSWADAFTWLAAAGEMRADLTERLDDLGQNPPTLEQAALRMEVFVGTAHLLIIDALERSGLKPVMGVEGVRGGKH